MDSQSHQPPALALLITGSEYTVVLEDPPCLMQEALLSSPPQCTRSLKCSAGGAKVCRIPKRQCTLRPLSYSSAGPKLSQARGQVCRVGAYLTQTEQRVCESPGRLSKAILNSSHSQKQLGQAHLKNRGETFTASSCIHLAQHRLVPICYFKAIGALAELLNVTRSRVGGGGQNLQN